MVRCGDVEQTVQAGIDDSRREGMTNDKRKEMLRLLRRVIGQFQPYRSKVGLVGVLVLFTAGLRVTNPLLEKAVFDQALFVPGGPNLRLLGLLGGLMIATPIAAGGLTLWRTYLTNTVGQQVMRDLRCRLYTQLQALSLRFFTATRTGEIQSWLANDVGGLQNVITDTAVTLLSGMVIIISAIIAMAILSWQMTLLSLAILPLFCWQGMAAGRTLRQVSATTQVALADMSAITEETLSVPGALLTKIFGRQPTEIARYAAQNERLTTLQVRHQMIKQVVDTAVATFFSLTPALIYLVAGFAHNISLGTLVAFLTLQFQVFIPLGQVLGTVTEVSGSLALFERVYGYLALTPDIIDSPSAVPLPIPVRGTVRLDDVWFSYDDPTPTSPNDSTKGSQLATERRWALRGVSLDVAPGMLVALVGPSGAGKTTISYLIPRLYEAARGAVRIDGIDVRQTTQASLAETIGMVTQDSYLFHASIRANLAYARPDASDADIEAATRAAQIHHRILDFDDGYDTVVGERGYRLSGGERQRIAIARVILRDPRVLILDEATSALDTVNERLVQAALAPLMAGRTTIAIAHRLSTIRAADIIYVLDAGRITETGTHKELLARNGAYTRLYEEQFGAGAVEARCDGGVVLANGSVITLPAAANPCRH
jgi:ATP-binding cassette subfamily B protein